MRRAERLGDLPEPEQPGVRVGGVGEPLSITGSSVRWIAAVRETPAGQRLQVPQRGDRVEVAERGEPLLGRLRREPGLVAGELRHRGEQRPVEELLVQPADLPAVPLPLLVELGDRLLQEPHRPAEPAQLSSSSGTTWVRRSWGSCMRCSSVRRNR